MDDVAQEDGWRRWICGLPGVGKIWARGERVAAGSLVSQEKDWEGRARRWVVAGGNKIFSSLEYEWNS